MAVCSIIETESAKAWFKRYSQPSAFNQQMDAYLAKAGFDPDRRRTEWRKIGYDGVYEYAIWVEYPRKDAIPINAGLTRLRVFKTNTRRRREDYIDAGVMWNIDAPTLIARLEGLVPQVQSQPLRALFDYLILSRISVYGHSFS